MMDNFHRLLLSFSKGLLLQDLCMEKWLKVDKTCMCQHIIQAGQELGGMGGVFLCSSCTERAVQAWWYRCSLVSGVSAPGLVGMFVSSFMDLCDCQLAAFQQPECSVLSVIRPIKQVLGCFPSMSTLLPVHPSLLLSFSPSDFFLPECSCR